MLKYTETEVVFKEVPDEITLAINISGCPIHCPGCHSKHLWEDIGENLTEQSLDDLLKKNHGISCISFMGGDSDPISIDKLAKHIKSSFPNLKVAWYSGREKISEKIHLEYFDFIKIGPYLGDNGLINPNTNQIFYKILDSGKTLIDITNRFYK